MSDTYKINVNTTITLTTEDIDNIMCSALEGGINYWADAAEVPEGERVAEWGHEQIARGGRLLIHLDEPFDDEDTEVYELTLEKFLGGFKLYMEAEGDRSTAVDDMDSGDADCIIQYALFGGMVFC